LKNCAYLCYIYPDMAKAQQQKSTSSKKSKGTVRDIKPKSSSKPDAFKIHHLEDEDVPTVEPLIEVESLEDEFKLSKISEDEASKEDIPAEPEISIQEIEEEVEESIEDIKKVTESVPKDTVKVRFDKFVQLVLSRDIEEILDINADQEIIMSSNLLTDLAGSESDVKEEKRTPLVFIVGIAMGIIITYLFFSS
jgi:hypothetical protein